MARARSIIGRSPAMNYRHAYHAGNFADVVKHAVLCRVLVHLREKPTPFRVIDTHAGAGVHDLTGKESGKTGELVWQFTKAGTVDFACPLPGHFKGMNFPGMKGTIKVESK